ncbi:MAG TPA: response regulator [Pyrinomonadaceae bacterium]|nr:response regulator [Pyrinomonadaceae bacterium]
MARVMICDDDRAMAERLVEALRAAGHEAETCRHTMDVLRAAAAGSYDLIAVGLDMAGFGRAGAVEALREIAPQTSVIALHDRPSEIMRVATQSRIAAVLPRPVRVKDFMYAVACALKEQTVMVEH